MASIDEKLGKRIIGNLNGISEIADSIKELENICDKYSRNEDSDYSKEGWARENIIEWAYAGCISAGMNGGDYKKRIKAYVDGIKQTLEHNRYSDPAFYVQEVFNAVFK